MTKKFQEKKYLLQKQRQDKDGYKYNKWRVGKIGKRRRGREREEEKTTNHKLKTKTAPDGRRFCF